MKQRIITLATALSLTSGLAMAKIYTGTVWAVGDDEPLIGATVMVKGTSVGVTTDIDGNFSIDIPEKSKFLVISYVGMEPKELQIGKLREKGNQIYLDPM